MAVIDGRGLVDDGSSALQVQGPVTLGSFQHSVSKLSTNTTLTVPGHYQYSTVVTATLPAPASFPGSVCVFSPVPGGGFGVVTGGGALLTGSATVGNTVFACTSGAFGLNGASKTQGSKLTLASSGSVVLVSDGNFWLATAGSGSVTFA